MAKQGHNPVLCALDTQDPDEACALVQALGGRVGGVKLGLEFFSAAGRAGVEAVAAAGLPIFLDLKLHDIPNTVARAVAALVPLHPFMMTVHTAGGLAMMKAAVESARATADRLGISRPQMVGVTVLTSLDDKDLNDIGVNATPADQAARLAALALDAGLDGVVCSPHEVARLRKLAGPSFTLVVPGIRPAGTAPGDQKRVMTPAEALAAGASHLVIGRPITEAADPAAAAGAIAAELGAVPQAG
ncbi:MAG: orotidine-5'-phosphate decarboxylase [Alphaproteobacteria bacterium]|nr:MAG: orotidine-5'-phosphate decarboxylase [Alphaproteobacteria bacterium]